MHNEHLFWESGSALVMGCCIDNCMVRHNKSKHYLLLKKERGRKGSCFLQKYKYIIIHFFFSQLKKESLALQQKPGFSSSLYSLWAKDPMQTSSALTHQKGSFVVVASTPRFRNKTFCTLHQDDAFSVLDAPQTSIGTLHQMRALLLKLHHSWHLRYLPKYP